MQGILQELTHFCGVHFGKSQEKLSGIRYRQLLSADTLTRALYQTYSLQHRDLETSLDERINNSKSHSLRASSSDKISQGGRPLVQISGIVQLQMCKSDKKFSCSKNAS